MSYARRIDRPEVKPIVQITCEIAGGTPDGSISRVRTAFLDWLARRQRVVGIPDSAWNGEPFEIDASQDRPVSVEAFEDIWAMRFDNPDQEIPNRQWRTEAIIGKQDERALLGVRLTAITRTWDIPVPKSIPRVVRDLADQAALKDYGFSLAGAPWTVTTEEDTRDLVRLLEAPGRTRPVFVVSSSADGNAPIDAGALARRITGVGHVATISPRAAKFLSEIVGDDQSVYGSAMRTYSPGFDREIAEWERHPVATREWVQRRFSNSEHFISLLASRAIAVSVSMPDMEDRLPSFSKVRQTVAQRRLVAARRQSRSSSEYVELLEADNQKLREDLQAADDLLEERTQFQKQSDDHKESLARQIHGLKARISHLEKSRSNRLSLDPTAAPSGYDQLENWATDNLAGRVFLLPRALRSVKKADFRDIALVCNSLLLLGQQYRAMRLGEISPSECDEAANEIGVEISSTGSEARLMQWREEYEVAWRGGRQFLDMHLKKGTSREPRSCLRIYFFWDDEDEQIVVGHLPSHLTSETT